MNWIDIYAHYLGLKLHFEKNYDYIKYGGRYMSEYQIRKYYTILTYMEGKNESLEGFQNRLVAVFRKNPKAWLTDIYTKEADIAVSEYMSEINNWSYNLKTDVETACDIAMRKGISFKEIFISDNEFRLALFPSLMESGKIKMHSFCAVDQIIPFIDDVSGLLFDCTVIRKYRDLHEFDKKRIAVIVKPFLDNFNKCHGTT